MTDGAAHCPRCGVTVVESNALHGPCSTCRAQLREMRPPAPDPRYGPAHELPYDPASPMPYRPVPRVDDMDIRTKNRGPGSRAPLEDLLAPGVLPSLDDLVAQR